MPLLALVLSALPGLAEVLSFPSQESFGWFAYAPRPALASLAATPWLPFVLCGLTLWAPRVLGPVGVAATCATLAVGTLVTGEGTWFSITCHVAVLAILALVWRRGYRGERPALFTGLAWAVAVIATAWDPLERLVHTLSWEWEREAGRSLEVVYRDPAFVFDPGLLWAMLVAVFVTAAHLTGRRLVALMAVPLPAIMAASCWPSWQAVPYGVAGVALLLAYWRPAIPREAPPPMVALALVGAVATLVMVYFAP
ncbi:hypothetical protein [Nonomuraea dietziae]|uniref:Uncharacterized protein n=1 Tax=Nonomuraea dietziae TaxID=65515 RepID=A0A7W5VL11_9ACTN|nr:hypothetical protein [Nonomuraea dietziae]MBB3729827.1 hypothetical protein [Nonomuraea dietziae]